MRVIRVGGSTRSGGGGGGGRAADTPGPCRMPCPPLPIDTALDHGPDPLHNAQHHRPGSAQLPEIAAQSPGPRQATLVTAPPPQGATGGVGCAGHWRGSGIPLRPPISPPDPLEAQAAQTTSSWASVAVTEDVLLMSRWRMGSCRCRTTGPAGGTTGPSLHWHTPGARGCRGLPGDDDDVGRRNPATS